MTQIAFDNSTPLGDLALVHALPVWAVRHIQFALGVLSARPALA